VFNHTCSLHTCVCDRSHRRRVRVVAFNGGSCFTAGGFPSNPILVRVCAEHLNCSSWVLTVEIGKHTQFINIVGQRRQFPYLLPRHWRDCKESRVQHIWCSAPCSAPPPFPTYCTTSLLNSLIPPTHPRIVAVRGHYAWLEKSLRLSDGRCTYSTFFPLHFCTHSSNQLGCSTS
jgi:hypothetical protein